LIWTGLQIIDADEGSLLLLDDTTEDLRFAMNVGNDKSLLIGQRVPVGKGVTGLAAATRTVQIGAPIYRDIEHTERMDGTAPDAVIAAPMQVGDRLIGVITGVSFRKGHRFDSQAGRVFGGFAAIAGVIVDQEQRLAALTQGQETIGTGEAEIATRLAVLRRQRPEVIEDVIAIIRLVEKLAVARP
jgi:GAF domain-containing protein